MKVIIKSIYGCIDYPYKLFLDKLFLFWTFSIIILDKIWLTVGFQNFLHQ